MAIILELPNEVLAKIVGHRDFVSLFFLRATCRKLYLVLTESQITKAFFNLETPRDNISPEQTLPTMPVCDLHDYPWLQRRLPCYDCMRLLPKWDSHI